MAVSTSNRFGSGSAIGVPQVACEFDKFASYATPIVQIGFKVEDSGGSVYRFSHFGANCDRGVLVAQDISESSLGDSDNVIVASASCTDTTDGTIGSRFMEITGGDPTLGVTANEFAGGKFITSDDTGEGYTYDIIGNTANATSASSFRLELRQKLQKAVGATTDFIIVGNKYANLEIATRTTDNFVAGVSCRQMDTNYPYGWIQTKGVVGALSEGTDVIGEKIFLSAVTSGAFACISNAAESTYTTLSAQLGSCIVAGDDSGHGAYYINLE